MDKKQLDSIVEAVLFAAGEPVSAARIAEIVELTPEDIAEAVARLNDFYHYEKRGMDIIRIENMYQMCSRKEYADIIRKVLESRKPPMLGESSLEVLAMVAYRQPVTKVYIEQVRGVDCTYTINNLMEKKLICETGRLDVPGRPILYGTTPDFLRCFGLSALDELPSIPEFSPAEQLAFPSEE